MTSWYGPWDPMTPAAVRDLLAGSDVRWWIAGGHAVDAHTGTRRAHGDIDVAVARDDIPALRRRLAGWHLWEAHDGALKPLHPHHELRPDRHGLWARRDASSPWRLDLLVSAVADEHWLFKNDHGIRIPMPEAVTHHGGIPYLALEAVLLHKSRLMRDKDRRDFTTALPHLSDRARKWLATALERHRPGHEWLPTLRNGRPARPASPPNRAP
ncbi:nucleotidyltransferase domain-containing protein [Stackebrandtia albiflava]|uniref:nucleotidyltransferase domain-containing protein n=1 Tax=Stackebrandtia albiflava TaxID=406432 RepID=UPI0011BDD100|nr:hypothetical protein [Stackebrandtia albiflava]